jgi:RNA polymerase sigma-70 factor (ECF subfamily)
MRSRRAPSEPDLVDRARQGDVDAFEVLLRRHDDPMRALAHRMLGSRAAMDDALQDAYVRAFRSVAGFRGDARFSTWLHRIVATTCIDHLRRSGRRAEDELGEEPRVVGGRQDPAGDAAVGRVDLRRALNRLDVDQLAVLLLVDGEGLSYDEVAAILGIANGTVSSRVTRARLVMRTLLLDGRESS